MSFGIALRRRSSRRRNRRILSQVLIEDLVPVCAGGPSAAASGSRVHPSGSRADPRARPDLVPCGGGRSRAVRARDEIGVPVVGHGYAASPQPQKFGKIVGIIAYKKIGPNTAELSRLTVDMDYRRMKIGQRLIQALIDLAQENGFEEIYLNPLLTILTLCT